MSHCIPVYAVKPNGDKFEIFTSYPIEKNLFERRNGLLASLRNGSWEKWSGERRVARVRTAKEHGWPIEVGVATCDTETV